VSIDNCSGISLKLYSIPIWPAANKKVSSSLNAGELGMLTSYS